MSFDTLGEAVEDTEAKMIIGIKQILRANGVDHFYFDNSQNLVVWNKHGRSNIIKQDRQINQRGKAHNIASIIKYGI